MGPTYLIVFVAVWFSLNDHNFKIELQRNDPVYVYHTVNTKMTKFDKRQY